MKTSNYQYQQVVSAGHDFGECYPKRKLAGNKIATATDLPSDSQTISALVLTLNESLAVLNDQLAHIETLIEKSAGEREWYSIQEAAKLLDKAVFTVREWCRLNRINALKRESGRGRYREWMISHKELKRIREKGLLPLNL